MNTKGVLLEGRIPTEAGNAPHVSEQASSPVSEDTVSDVFSYVVLPVGRYSCDDLKGLVIVAKPREDSLPDHSSNTELGGE